MAYKGIVWHEDQGGGVLGGRAARWRNRFTPLRIVLVYAAVGVTWILLSDTVLAAVVGDPLRVARLQHAKGVAYVCVTAALLLFLIRRHEEERRVHDEEVRAVLAGMADA